MYLSRQTPKYWQVFIWGEKRSKGFIFLRQEHRILCSLRWQWLKTRTDFRQQPSYPRHASFSIACKDGKAPLYSTIMHVSISGWTPSIKIMNRRLLSTCNPTKNKTKQNNSVRQFCLDLILRRLTFWERLANQIKIERKKKHTLSRPGFINLFYKVIHLLNRKEIF